MARNTTSALAALIRTFRRLLRRVAGQTADQQKHAQPTKPAARSSQPPVKTNPAKRPEKHREPATPKPPAKPAAPACPHCKKTMVIKVARTGKNAGEFWGCVAYPKCRGIRPIFR
ncbi:MULTISPECIES: topoisomerase DNA-binding C4 zinc finger domain-containing protein [Pseudomonas syringae group]|uniref:topoisomerase DNA-binding C4 zinc finger domain-containing protein n=1 Tax=Pseudomonas syringae group TaxID=136849 RepID=UPI001C5A2A3E|nr:MULTISPECIES: topoisomerase DNA-binding C4 zinc finger domain-containing protein [Pseudomonas syringae group]MDU8543840.1 topoisomerase DNA-binding C4 zinc finger domain-containing protein [Pseudomonas syringae group sp. J248-6]QXW43771.1 topoisomerase DNA-binding C4 zinc finger domain-containing protein [Pseudomonas amygdali]